MARLPVVEPLPAPLLAAVRASLGAGVDAVPDLGDETCARSAADAEVLRMVHRPADGRLSRTAIQAAPRGTAANVGRFLPGEAIENAVAGWPDRARGDRTEPAGRRGALP